MDTTTNQDAYDAGAAAYRSGARRVPPPLPEDERESWLEGFDDASDLDPRPSDAHPGTCGESLRRDIEGDWGLL